MEYISAQTSQTKERTDLFVLVGCSGMENNLVIIARCCRSEWPLVSDGDSVDNLRHQYISIWLVTEIRDE